MMDESLQRAMKLKADQKVLLALVHGQPVLREHLLDLLYAHDPDGGPLGAEAVLRAVICNLRKKLRAEGWDIETIRGYALNVNREPPWKTPTELLLPSISNGTGGGSSPATNSQTSSAPVASTPSRSRAAPSTPAVRPDFLSKPSQHIGS
jgi:hypothetical protein